MPSGAASPVVIPPLEGSVSYAVAGMIGSERMIWPTAVWSVGAPVPVVQFSIFVVGLLLPCAQ